MRSRTTLLAVSVALALAGTGLVALYVRDADCLWCYDVRATATASAGR